MHLRVRFHEPFRHLGVEGAEIVFRDRVPAADRAELRPAVVFRAFRGHRERERQAQRRKGHVPAAPQGIQACEHVQAEGVRGVADAFVGLGEGDGHGFAGGGVIRGGRLAAAGSAQAGQDQ